MQWPANFMWGTGASSTQSEGAAPGSDWWDWERAGKAPMSGDGNGFADKYAGDFRLYAGLGLIHHRLSIEWARIEPEPGVIDERAVAHYRDLLTAAREAGIAAWICLHHFTLPRWFAADGGFLVTENRTGPWTRHVERVADLFGDLAAGWKPVNETNYYPMTAYLGWGWSPGHNDPEEAATVTQAIQLATAEAAVRLKQTGKPVASVFALATEALLDDSPATAQTAQRLRDTNWNVGLGLFRDGVLRVPGREPIERPDLAGSFDLIGFSYYLTFGVREGAFAPYPPDAPRSPLGYAVSSDGLRLVLERLHAEVPGVPLLVAEYGIGTDDDAMRAEYLREGLQITNDAIARGIDVRGFFHWTGVDNYEWLHGFDVAFGVIDRERNIRPSARVLQTEAL
ncbi:MAG TPA: family 1 glycosylhydrolase [Frankiaceae bacterium]|jgi:beta-glucosidase|nr:family 1 glycosylhydrolase [Frankiaceae bacterium]